MSFDPNDGYCEGCGCPETIHRGRLEECPFCGSSKCERCDRGDDVRCRACESEADLDE